MKGKWQPVIMASIHQTEPPSALAGEHYYRFKNENDRWKAYEFTLPDCGWFILLKFGSQWGKNAERACLNHFNNFQALGDCVGIN